MKKIVVCGFMLLAAASMSLLSSCSDDKVIQSEAALDETRTATFVLYTSYLSESTSTTPTAVPNTTKVLFVAKNSDLGNDAAKGSFIREVSIAQSPITVSLPAVAGGVEYSVVFSDFVAKYKGATDPDPKDYIFSAKDVKVKLEPGKTAVQKVEYAAGKSL